MEKVIASEEVNIQIIDCFSFTEERQCFWVDYGDALILLGGLHIIESMIYLFDAYNLEIDANNVPTTLSTFLLETMVENHPNLLTPEEKLSFKLNLALEEWLKASSYFKESIEFKLSETGYQENDLFILDRVEGRNSVCYLTLMDNVFTGLLNVTGGDLNGDKGG